MLRMRNNLLFVSDLGLTLFILQLWLFSATGSHFHSVSAIRFYPGSVSMKKLAAVLQETGKNSPFRQNHEILGTSPWWKGTAVLMNVSCSHWPPVLEDFWPLCSFLSAVVCLCLTFSVTSSACFCHSPFVSLAKGFHSVVTTSHLQWHHLCWKECEFTD